MALLFFLILAICTRPGLSGSLPRVRLVAGSHPCEGRVEVEQQGQWGLVCDDGWDMTDVAVLCQELGCGVAKRAINGNEFKPLPKEDQKILIQNVECKGMEKTLFQCKKDEDVFDCSLDEAAGAVCENLESPVFEDMRLADGSGFCQGRVELKYQDTWNAVCQTGWNLQAAKVVCRQLGCGRAVLTMKHCEESAQGQRPIWPSQMFCSGQEVSLQDCPSRPREKSNCTLNEHVWVECEDAFDLRLAGDKPCSGRLEVLHKGVWGSVCDDGWGAREDQVVCKQLGCGKPLSPSLKDRKSYGPGVGPIWLDDVYCSGKEHSLEYCRHRFWGYHDCTHKEDIAVICSE